MGAYSQDQHLKKRKDSEMGLREKLVCDIVSTNTFSNPIGTCEAGMALSELFQIEVKQLAESQRGICGAHRSIPYGS